MGRGSTRGWTWTATGLTPAIATRGFFTAFPHAFLRPSQATVVGIAFWLFDSVFLSVVQHGTHVMLWLTVIAVALVGHIVVMFHRMKDFVANWPSPGYSTVPDHPPSADAGAQS